MAVEEVGTVVETPVRPLDRPTSAATRPRIPRSFRPHDWIPPHIRRSARIHVLAGTFTYAFDS
jgi:hypothetical protein